MNDTHIVDLYRVKSEIADKDNTIENYRAQAEREAKRCRAEGGDPPEIAIPEDLQALQRQADEALQHPQGESLSELQHAQGCYLRARALGLDYEMQREGLRTKLATIERNA